MKSTDRDFYMRMGERKARREQKLKNRKILIAIALGAGVAILYTWNWLCLPRLLY